MANYNPWQARMKRWQKRWPVPIEEIQAHAYGVLMMAYEGVMVEDDEQRRKNILAYVQALTSFAKLVAPHATPDTPALPGDIILIRSTAGSNGHHGD
jgi:hypothetical protein